MFGIFGYIAVLSRELVISCTDTLAHRGVYQGRNGLAHLIRRFYGNKLQFKEKDWAIPIGINYDACPDSFFRL